MPSNPASIMKQVDNIQPLYADKIGLFRKWIREDDKWDEKKALVEAKALAAHFAEAIETLPWPQKLAPHYTTKDFAEAAEEMVEEFKNEERPKWAMGAVEGWAITHDGETLKSGMKDDFEAVKWLHKRHGYSVDHAVTHEGYDVVLIRDGKVVYSYRQEAKKRKS